MAPSNNYTLNVQFGTCDNNCQGAGEAWIDFNGNGVFEPSESLGSWQGTPPVPISTFNFTVPAITASNPVRLRITQQEDTIPPLDPCASFTWGCTIDFEVQFGTPMDCSGYIGDSIANPRIVDALPFLEPHSNLVCYTNNVPVYNSPDVFYRIIPSELGIEALNVSLCGSSIDTYLQIQDSDGSVLDANDDYSSCSPQSEISLGVTDYDTVYAVVQGWNNEVGDYHITIQDGLLASTEEEQQDIKIFPNPADDQLFFHNLSVPATIRIIDLNGKVLREQLLQPNDQIDVNLMASGCYLIEINTSQTVTTKKLIVQHEN